MKTTVNNYIKYAERMPVKIGLYLAIAATVVGVGGSSVLAWGPDRAAISYKNPIDYVSFNNYTDGPAGDERNFFVIKDAANTLAGGWQDSVAVEDGKEYIARIYIHNNAAENLNLKATNTRVSVAMGQSGGTSTPMTAYVSADNAKPQKVWDDVVMTSDKKFNIAYVQGSAMIYNNGYAAGGQGKKFTDNLVTSGAPVGYAAEGDGVIPGCFQYAQYITFKVRAVTAKTPNFTIDKKARVSGTKDWQTNVTAKPGDKLDYRIAYTNTGEVVQNNVVVKDKMAANVTYKNGSTTLLNQANPNGLGMTMSDDMFTKGLNIGNYGPKANAGVYYNATVPAADKLKCGVNNLPNTATVETDNGGKDSTATVTVNVECKPNECKPGIPAGDKRCEKCVPQNGQTVDKDGNCVAAPTSLPKTGPGQVVAGIIAIMAMAAGIVYFYKSRQDLKKAMATGGTITTQAKAADTAEDAPKLLKARTDTNSADDKKEL